MREAFVLKIKRRDHPESPSYWDEFKIPYRPNMNVVSSLMEIRKNPVNAAGKTVNPVVWECNCLEEVCGACSMLVNGVPRQACSALIDKILAEKGEKKPIVLEPFTKFPVIRDLMIDRTRMFDILKQMKAWVPVDGSFPLGRGPRFDEHTRSWAYEISRCMTCGCCMEACPNVNEKSGFVGPSVIAQVRMFNAHPIGKMYREERLEALKGYGGIQDCGNSQNCVKVCPHNIPLTTSIARMNMDVNVQAIKGFFKR